MCKNDDSLLRSLNNQEDEEEFSGIFVKEMNQTEVLKQPFFEKSSEKYLYEMVTTLREIKEMTKENLITKKKLVRLLEEKSQISYLYDK